MPGNNYAYHRISTATQHLDRGIIELKNYFETNGITLTDDIYCDKITGKTFERSEYKKVKAKIERGDSFYITEMDRLGRSRSGILKELRELKEKGVYIRILEIPTTLMDFRNIGDNELCSMMLDVINNMLIDMFAAFAETEIHKKEKRQREGIEAMKLRGDWEEYGRPRKISLEVFAEEYHVKSMQMIMKEYNISRATYYNYRKEILKSSS